jgi:protein FrlC
VELWGGQFHGYVLDLVRQSGDELILDDARVAKIRDLCKASGLSLVCYNPEQCIYPINYLMGDVDPFDGARLVEKSRQLIRLSIDISDALGCKRMVLASPLWHWRREGGSYTRVTKQQAIEATVRALELFARYAEDRGVAILFEPLVYHDSNAIETLDDVAALMDQVPSPYLQLLLDSGHIHVTANRAGVNPVDYFRAHLERFGKRVTHIHLDDNSGREDSHLLPGEGTVDFAAMIELLKNHGYQGWLSLEVTGLGPYAVPEKAELLLYQGKRYIDELLRGTS